MATRYISAIEYADHHAKKILKKHAKKRPLGEIESKHRYTPPQPVLSCRTVDIDVSGTRTYRSRSTTDIIQEQHKLIHKIVNKPSRNITSAPQGRNFSPRYQDDEFSRRQRINIEVHGRPLTSQSQSAISQANRANSSVRRPKTTGGFKKTIPKGYTVLRAEKDILETSRHHRDLTNKIRKQWEPENHDLNVGTFVRGQSKPDAPPSLDNWLTFGGVHSEETCGVIDAFAEITDNDQYYSIEGGVGSRVAQQLQKGDKIRVGINGRIQSQDLKIKRPETRQETPVVEKSEKENMEKSVVPLCWGDTTTTLKVISPREKGDDAPRQVMSETHPVYFPKGEDKEKSIRERIKSTAQSRSEGFKVKHRKKLRPSMDGQKDEKIVVITIDQKTDHEANKLDGISVDDVLKRSFSGRSVSGFESERDTMEVNSQSTAPTTSEYPCEHKETPRSQSKASMVESYISMDSVRSVKITGKPVSPSPVSPKPSSADLMVGPTFGRNFRNETPIKSNSATRIGSDKSQSRVGSAKHLHNKPTPPKPVHIAYSSPSSFNVYGAKGETEFIQITSQIRNPNPQATQHSNTIKETYIASANENAIQEVVRENEPVIVKGESIHNAPAPSPDFLNHDEPDLEVAADGMITAPPTARSISPASSGFLINIPTAEEVPDLDSQGNSPWPSHRGGMPSDNGLPAHVKREHAMRDNQIDQITSLLKGAIVNPADQLIEKEHIEKTVTFEEGS